MVKVGIVGTAGLPANYGGFETLAKNLIIELQNQFEFLVYCSPANDETRPEKYKKARLVYIPFKANGAQSTPYDIASMLHAVKSVDVILVLGVSGCIFLPFLRIFPRKKIIVNIDGLEWRRHKWGRVAKWFLKFSEKISVNHADVVVTDNQAIKDYVKSEYGKESVLIAYGGDHVLVPSHENENSVNKFIPPFEKYAIKVCRVEPENNVHVVLEAFSRADRLPLVIVGNWDASEYGIQLREKYKDTAHIKLMDPVYDRGALYDLRSNAELYIHGHSAGGTNPSLVEAMCFGLPVIAFDVRYNRETTQNRALFFSDSDSLNTVLNHLGQSEVSKVGAAMKEVAMELYTCKRITGEYARLFFSAQT